jgi:hypothetical protein
MHKSELHGNQNSNWLTMEARGVVAVLLVMLCMCDLPIQARTRSTGFPLTSEGMATAADDDDKPRLQHPDVSNLLKHPSCADFLLNGVFHLAFFSIRVSKSTRDF